MNRIEELIKQHCADGVEYKELGEVAYITIGEFVHKNEQNTNGRYPVYNGGISYTGFYDEYNNSANKIVISARGANAGFVNRVLVNFWAGNSCYSISFKDAFLFDWIFGFFYLKHYENKLIGDQQKGGIPAVSKKMIEKFLIPIPPLPIQQEIASILVKFTQLEAELEAELEARKKQYEYYRNQLLNFEGKEVVWKTLGEVAYYPKHRIPASIVDETNYVGVDNLLQNRQGKTLSSYVPTLGNLIEFKSNDILIGNIRPYLKKIWISNIVGGTNGDVLVVRINNDYSNKCIPRFLYYLLASDVFFRYNMQSAKGAKMPRGDKDAILKYPVPIPTLPEQERIVGILDKFDSLVNDISVGLPAEIETRRKQYKYYRGKLLDFKSLNNG